MEFGSFTQVNATVFICGTLHKYTDEYEFISSSVFVGRVNPEAGQELTYLHSWGEKDPNKADVCKKLEYDEEQG